MLHPLFIGGPHKQIFTRFGSGNYEHNVLFLSYFKLFFVHVLYLKGNIQKVSGTYIEIDS